MTLTLEAGQVIDGKYRIVRLIGEGGMGEVYEGENVRIRRRVAIKVLHPGFTDNTDVVQRFEREAQAAGRIGNDHILEVLDLGSLSDGSYYMVMEFLDGEPLSKRIEQRTRLDPREVVPIARQLLQGLAAAHSAGIVHRDLKPDNIFILKEKAGKVDYVKIIDFGISKFQPLSGDGMKMTRTGAVMGTPYYMSPEQASGSHEADSRSDLYAVGVILYEAVTGQVPFDAPSFNQLLFQIVLSEPPPPRAVNAELDPAFETVILKAMARDVTQRFQTAQDFIAALDAWEKTGASVSVPPAGPMQNVVHGARASMVGTARQSAIAQTPHAQSGANWSASQPGASGSNWGASESQPGQPGSSWPGVAPQPAPAAAHRATGGSWATSQPGTAQTGVTTTPAKKSAAPLIVAIGAGVVMLVGGIGAFLAFRSSGSTTTPEAAAGTAASVTMPAETAKPVAPAPPAPQAPAVTPDLQPAPSATAAAAKTSEPAKSTSTRSSTRSGSRASTPSTTKSGKTSSKSGGGDDFGY